MTLRSMPADIELLLKIIDARPVLWVGAGTSMAAGYPSVAGILAAMRAKALRSLPSSNDYPTVADAFFQNEGEASMAQLMSELFNPRSLTDWHQALARLLAANQFAAVVTTNYDDLIERALAEKQIKHVLQTIDKNFAVTDPLRIIKLHGGHSDWRSIVLTEQSYAQFQLRYPLVENQLNQLLHQHPVLFVGCSMTDPRILSWLAGHKSPKSLHPWRALISKGTFDQLHKPLPSGMIPAEVLSKTPFDALLLKNYEHLSQLFGDLAEARAAGSLSSTSPQPVLQPFRMPHRRNLAFFGRTDDLVALANELHPCRTTALVPQVAITGLGGLGKTQLAVEFAYRYQVNYPGGVFWLDCGTAGSVPSEIAECGVKMQLYSPSDPRSLPDKVEAVIQAWTSGSLRLLIFDNCEDEALLAKWAPRQGPNHVLITSCDQNWSPELVGYTLRLATLARAESQQLLRGLCPTLTLALSDAIASELGDLPLALYLAGKYLATYGQAADYLTKLRNQPLQALTGKGTQARYQPTSHDTHVGNTFALSYAKLDPSNTIDQTARTLLLHASYLAPGEPIPRDILLATLLGLDHETGIDALQRLSQLGLLRPQDDTDQVHRLVQVFCRESHPRVEQDQAETTVAKTLIKISYTANETHHPIAMAQIRAHLQHLAESFENRLTQLAVDLCGNLGFHYSEVAAWPEAERWYLCSLAASEKVNGPEAKETAIHLNNLAELYRDTHRLEEAEPLIIRALTIGEATLGPHHPQVASALNNLALLCYATKRFSEAESLMVRVVTIFETAYGPDHPNVAIALNNLAQLYQDSGQLEKAEQLMKRALAINKAAFGPNHPNVAAGLNNLAQLYKNSSRLQEAEVLMMQVLTIYETAFGSDHPNVALALNNLAGVYEATNRLAEAELLLRRALAIDKASFDPNHPNVSRDRNNLAGLYLPSTGMSRQSS